MSIDRRSLRYVWDTFNDDTVFNLVCMVCAQSKTHTGLVSSRSTDTGYFEKLTDIQYRRGADLINMWQKNLDHFDNNFGFRTFMQRYGTDWQDPSLADEDLREFGPTRWEWRRALEVGRDLPSFEMLCCPEDIKCTRQHPTESICLECQVPICKECWFVLRREKNVPMALANDNHWGYVVALIKRYKVRWIEMAAVLPYWTCMIVYYVEGDYGHLMNEEVQGTRQRTAVRGQAFSFLMPWEQIVKGLTQRVKAIPRDPECLKYMLRLHLKVAGQDFHSHLLEAGTSAS